MKLSISNINDILKEAYFKYEDRPAEEFKAYMDGITDLLNLIAMEDTTRHDYMPVRDPRPDLYTREL